MAVMNITTRAKQSSPHLQHLQHRLPVNATAQIGNISDTSQKLKRQTPNDSRAIATWMPQSLKNNSTKL